MLMHWDDHARPPSPFERRWCRYMSGRIIPVIISKILLPDDFHIPVKRQRTIDLEGTNNYSNFSIHSNIGDEEENELS